MKQRLVSGELADCLGLVALSQVHLDKAGSGALPEWVCPHRRTGSASGLTAAASGCQAASQRLQGMQSQLAPVLCLEPHPVVVPVRQQLWPTESRRRPG